VRPARAPTVGAGYRAVVGYRTTVGGGAWSGSGAWGDVLGYNPNAGHAMR